MIRVAMNRQAASLLMAGFSVARISLLTGISRNIIAHCKKDIPCRSRRKSHRKPEYLFERLEFFIMLVSTGMAPHVAIEICGRDQVLTAINYLFQYEKRKGLLSFC